jgi:hypothetical protein
MLTPCLRPFFCLSLLVVAPLAARAGMAQVNVADDDANQGMYGGGWNQGSGGDNGFFAWKMVSKSDGDGSFAGHYLARAEENAVIGPITSNRAFALFANGRGYEESVAFRGISVPLEPGDNFSFDILHGQFIPKGEEDDSTPSEVGVAYRTGNADGSVEDAGAGARLKVFAREGAPNYLVTDSEAEFDTGVPIIDEAIGLTITIRDADTYDLELISLRDGRKQLFEGRKFGGEAGAPIQSLAFFNRNSEATDFFFNNFQLSRNAP